MDSVQNVLKVIKKDFFMASIDLKNAFYSVPVTVHYQKYLRFLANEDCKFTCMPNRNLYCHENLYKDYERTIFNRFRVILQLYMYCCYCTVLTLVQVF